MSSAKLGVRPRSGRTAWLWALGLVASSCDAPGPLPLQPEGALHRAAYRGDLLATKAALQREVALEQKEGFEWTPLHYAAIAGHAEVAALLLDRGADPNARARYDLTPLHWAALKGHRDVVALLLSRGAKIDARNMYGQTPLHEAGNTQVVEALLAGGASMGAADFDGMTPLHIARSGDIARLLLARGSDIRLRARDGRTGLDVAVMEMLGPKGLMFYGARAPTRLRADHAHLSIQIRNISERVIPELTLAVESDACTGTSTPAQISRLLPAEQATMRFDLTRKPGTVEGEYRLDFVVRSAGALLGTVDLKVDTRTATTPEDLGMTRLGTGSLRKAGSRWGQLVFAVIPLLVAGLWWVAHRRRKLKA